MLLIKNGTIVDGTGAPPYKGDIFVSGNKISAIGNLQAKRGVNVIDAFGAQITPGFIDPNTDSDHQLTLFTNPQQKDFLLQGVTTIVGGNCGSSLAPLLYGSLESMRKWVDTSQINVDWHTMGEFFAALARRGIGVNFGTLVGHSTVRRAIIGEDARDLTEKEMRVFEAILERSFSEGALGFSTGLGYAHSSLVPFGEIERLAKIVAKRGGVYSTHLRNEEGGLQESVAETVALAKSTGVRVLISHLRPLLGFENRVAEVRLALNAIPEKLNFHFDIFPFDESVVPIYTFLPRWAKRGNFESMLQHLETPFMRDQIKAGFGELSVEKMTIADAPFNKYLIGKTIAEISREQKLDAIDALLRLMTTTRMRALILYKNINLDVTREMIFDNRAMVATNSAAMPENSAAISPERGTKTFTEYLRLARERGVPLETAIARITYEPARKFSISGRGVVKQGAFADLVLLHENKIEHVLVNGVVGVKNGVCQNVLAGKIVKKTL